ncbi:hypothetical protein FDECE_4855 [Fusarium decemcellulare]|nr:hypothetical protein FDECE_4855 [Fusarium decemcellulare]
MRDAEQGTRGGQLDIGDYLLDEITQPFPKLRARNRTTIVPEVTWVHLEKFDEVYCDLRSTPISRLMAVLLDHGAHLYAPNYNKETPFHFANERGLLDLTPLGHRNVELETAHLLA